jgi:hypothetical protein
MDHSSVEDALLVGPDVSGSIEWADERTVSFKPARDLQRDTEYLVTIGPEAKAADGEPIDGAYRSSRLTAPTASASAPSATWRRLRSFPPPIRRTWRPEAPSLSSSTAPSSR